MNKIKYIIPTIEVVKFNESDLIITTSTDPYIDPIWSDSVIDDKNYGK